MPQDPTPSVTPSLGPKQMLVLEALVAGASVSKAAEVCNVDRSTIHRWLRSDFNFIAAYNGARREMSANMRRQLLRTAQKAVEVVGKAVEAGDTRTALVVLKGCGLLDGEPFQFGSSDPAHLAQNARVAEQHRATLRRLDEMILRGAPSAQEALSGSSSGRGEKANRP